MAVKKLCHVAMEMGAVNHLVERSCGINDSSIMSRYAAHVMVCSMKKKGP
jgi:hypothetical protein